MSAFNSKSALYKNRYQAKEHIIKPPRSRAEEVLSRLLFKLKQRFEELDLKRLKDKKTRIAIAVIKVKED